MAKKIAFTGKIPKKRKQKKQKLNWDKIETLSEILTAKRRIEISVEKIKNELDYINGFLSDLKKKTYK